MIATVVGIATKVLFSNHLYTFGNKVYRQKAGGSIGDNATNNAEDIVMWRHITKYKEVLNKVGIIYQTIFLKINVSEYCKICGITTSC